ncbi:MAG: hypothetical protein WC728_07290 [Elusimicrobiota bacterium]
MTLALLLSLFAVGPLQADSWAPPKATDYLSENKRFMARAVPGQEAPTVEVYRTEGAKPVLVWRAALGGFPHKLFVSDDGRTVVKLDNYASLGYGDDVVAFYSESGESRRYSLEQVLALPPGTDMTRLFKHSVSSRWWTEDSVPRFVTFSGEPFFCLWLAWDNRWLAWRLSDGSPADMNAGLRRELDQALRLQALERVRRDAGGQDIEAYDMLAKLKDPADRKLFEEMLKDAAFLQLEGQDSKGLTELGVKSLRRWSADNALARWDGFDKTKEPGYGDSYFWASYELYRYLGSRVSGTFSFPKGARSGKGRLRIMLLPGDQRIDADLKGKKLNEKISFHLFGITPGVYRVKAVWDGKRPFCSSPEAGPITVTPGGVVDGVALDCRRP